MTPTPYSEYGSQPTPPSRKPPTWKKVLAWSAVFLGVIVILGNLSSGGFRGFLAGVCAGLTFLLPGAWYLLHERREANGATPLNRRWWWIIAACVGLLFLGAAINPETTTKPKDSTTSKTSTTPESTTSSMTPTSSELAPTSTTRTTEPSSAAPSTSISQDPTTEQPAPAPVPQEQPEPEQNTQIQQFAPAPEIQEEAPAPAPAQPAPAYSGGGNSGSCADIGHKVYRGDGIYLPKHDKDGDGVGCESYPG
ncbi:hypothetical protein [Corynebacterium striatum]|uniref:hypothetical protein n=1 Tax=Corynebacterium striatum TaxID=43770 RepID=UPI0027BB1CBA|nr:hypothetical protein [Corynebacterium striatum]